MAKVSAKPSSVTLLPNFDSYATTQARLLELQANLEHGRRELDKVKAAADQNIRARFQEKKPTESAIAAMVLLDDSVIAAESQIHRLQLDVGTARVNAHVALLELAFVYPHPWPSNLG